ncbi:MAG: hypothetical protein RLN62_05215 [Rickettsiales bacterium]
MKLRKPCTFSAIITTNDSYESVYRDSVSLQSIGKFDRAFERLSFLAHCNFAPGQFDLALLYYNGRGTVQNRSLAYHWLNKARINGCSDAGLFLEQAVAHDRQHEKESA